MTNLETVMNQISELKEMFSKKHTFATAELVDGTVIEYDGELAVGTAVFVVAEGEQIPAPDGTHALGGELTGVSVVTADGVITEIIDEREGGDAGEAPAEFEAIDSEEMPAALERATEVIASILNIEMGQAYDIATAVIAAINTEELSAESMSSEQVEAIVSAKLESFSKTILGIGEMMTSIVRENEAFKAELSGMKEAFEAFKAAPSNTEKEENKFSRQSGGLTVRQSFLRKQMK